ncbi:MAG: imidazolonepropionase, partial [Defluviitaleaceae bacterium]|nr:imidazolonepropionase [Defluviitaleaceae bacterium]
EILNAGGRLATPGLVDSHTHSVFGGFRQHELQAKLAGATYMEILQQGGGILSTVRATRAASHGELLQKTLQLLDDMLAHGTTTVEIKSGYGLDLDTEIKQLRVIEQLQKEHQMDIISTFMGAHAIPHEYSENPNGYADLLINEIIPEISSLNLAEYCDIFCEKAIFSIEQSRKILQAAKAHGFGVKIHADEIIPMGGAALAAELGAISAEHLIEADDYGLEQMSKSGTIAILLPATSFYLGKNFARAQKMIELGIPIAVATDFNPGSSPNYNMQFCLNLAYLKYRMNPAQALCAATLNAAAAIGLSESKGSVEIGKDADIILWDCPDLDFLFYRYGNNQVHKVIKSGCVLPC